MPNVGGSVLPAFAVAVSCRSSFNALMNSSLNARKSVPVKPALTTQYPAEVYKSGGASLVQLLQGLIGVRFPKQLVGISSRDPLRLVAQRLQ